MDWKDTKINIIDTPGMDDFVGEVISSFKVADTGIMVINAANGVEVGTEIIWEYADHLKKSPCCLWPTTWMKKNQISMPW